MQVSHFRTAVIVCMVVAGCAEQSSQTIPFAQRDALMDPATCEQCHPQHFREWSGSMHAYASKDPVFLAMNERGQRESNGELGDFCVQCHAPMALRTGATTDGLNLAEVPDALQGVTCYFCHTVTAVDGTHNNPLVLAMEESPTPNSPEPMLGGLASPNENAFHNSQYSPLLDRTNAQSADLCGSCHDIVTPTGVHIERTYHEWKNSLFGKEELGQVLTCGQCHMPSADGLSSTSPGGQVRRLHGHAMAGVDIALTEFPERDSQRAAVQGNLDNVLLPRICVTQHEHGATVTLSVENIAAGHSWPSGAAADRRAWVEFAFYAGQELVLAAGQIAEGEPLLEREDPLLWRLGDRALNDANEEVHLFWQASSIETNLLEAPTNNSPFGHGSRQTHVTREYETDTPVDTVTMQVNIRPIGLDIVDALIDSEDLDPALRDAIPTFTLRSTVIQWSPDQGTCVPY